MTEEESERLLKLEELLHNGLCLSVCYFQFGSCNDILDGQCEVVDVEALRTHLGELPANAEPQCIAYFIHIFCVAMLNLRAKIAQNFKLTARLAQNNVYFYIENLWRYRQIKLSLQRGDCSGAQYTEPCSFHVLAVHQRCILSTSAVYSQYNGGVLEVHQRCTRSTSAVYSKYISAVLILTLNQHLRL